MTNQQKELQKAATIIYKELRSYKRWIKNSLHNKDQIEEVILALELQNKGARIGSQRRK